MADLPPILEQIIRFGYPLMFIGMVVEGPMVTAAATFAASLGYFNLWWVFILAIMGDVLPDMGYYALGYFGHNAVIRRIVRWARISEERLDSARAFLDKHQIKGLMLFKYTPFLALTGLILTGTNRMPFKKFVLADTLIGIPNTLFFMAIGFFSGQAFGSVVKTVEDVRLVLFITIVIAIAIYWLYRRITKKVARN